MFGFMKDISNGLWNAGLCLLQVSCVFVVEANTSLLTPSLEIYILGVVSGRHSKGYKMLHNYPLTRNIPVSPFCHCDTGGATKCACVIVHNIPLSLLVQEELNIKVKRKLDSIIKVNERCLYGCSAPGQGDAVVCGMREIAFYPSPDQLQEIFRAPCVFLSTGWGIRKLTVKELASAMDLPQGNTSEALVLASVSYGEVISRFLALPPVKELQFYLAVTIIIGPINETKLKAEDNF